MNAMFNQYLKLKNEIKSMSGRFVMVQKLNNGKLGICSASISPYEFLTVQLETGVAEFLREGVYVEGDDVVYIFTNTAIFSPAREADDKRILEIADEVLEASKQAKIERLVAELKKLQG